MSELGNPKNEHLSDIEPWKKIERRANPEKKIECPALLLYTGRESGGKYELVVRVEDVDGLGSRSINFAQTEAAEDAGPLPTTSGIQST